MLDIISILTKRQEDSHFARYIVGILYSAILQNLQNEADFRSIFGRWQDDFASIHGNLDTQRQLDIDDLQAQYGVTIRASDEVLAFVFALETYYALLLRLIAARLVVGTELERYSIKQVLQIDFFASRAILNFSTEDVYDWPSADPDILRSCDRLVKFIANCNFNFQQDPIRNLFEELFPAKLRHAMGEFYTPEWLIDYVLRRITQNGVPSETATFLDPTCGSGSFLVSAMQKLIDDGVADPCAHLFGFDLNPLSALAAKTSLLLALDKHARLPNCPLVLPIFHTDAINSYLYEFRPDLLTSDEVTIPINGRNVTLPKSALRVRYAELRDAYLLLSGIGVAGNSERASKLYKLVEKQNLTNYELDRLLAALAPFSISDVDYIIGNPPWVNWEYLPNSYRDKTKDLWQYYDLFDLRGRDSNFIKEDISTLVTYVVLDRHLRSGGKLGFVVKQTLFKSAKHAEGFRRFIVRPHATPIRVLHVDDLTKVKVFKGIANRPAVVFLEKDAENRYPVSYDIWKTKPRKSLYALSSFVEARSLIDIDSKSAVPSDRGNAASGWVTFGGELSADKVYSILGENPYTARTGTFTGGANAVYWLSIKESVDTTVLVRNITERAKRKAKSQEVMIEKDHVYPMVTGRDIGFWRFDYDKYILCPHSATSRMQPISQDELENYPLTLDYLNSNRDVIDSRKGFAGWERHIQDEYWYAIQRIGAYTFSDYKVCWKFISATFTPVVVTRVSDPFLGDKNAIPNDKVIYVGLDDAAEAYYLCGVLSSRLYRDVIESYMVETQIGPSVLSKLRIPKFDPSNGIHVDISRVCQSGHTDASLIGSNLDILDELINKMVKDDAQSQSNVYGRASSLN
jgi:hypothetical protein